MSPLAKHNGGPRRPLIAGHPWVYAASMPDFDIAPIADTVFTDMRAAGLDGIELMGVTLRRPGAVERIKPLIERHELPVFGGTFGGFLLWDRAKRAEALDAAKLTIERVAALGGHGLGVSVGAAPRRKGEAEFDAQAEVLREMLRLCAQHGIAMNLHNHTHEVEHDEHDLRGTLARVPELKLGPDIGWLARAKVDPVDFVRRHGERIVFLHLRDQRADGTWSEALGEGAVDFAGIVRELRRNGFSGHLGIELTHEPGYVPTRSFRESFRLSREFALGMFRAEEPVRV